MRLDLLTDLAMLQRMQPLLEEGLVTFAPTDFMLCSKHQSTFSALQAGGPLKKIEGILYRSRLHRIRVETRATENKQVIVLRDLEEYLGHGDIALANVSRPQGEISSEEKRSFIEDFVTGPTIDDLRYHAFIGSLYGVRYLTDRPLDLEFLKHLPEADKRPYTTAGVAALTHSLPVLAEAPVDTLLKLRKEEGEAFELYRDGLNSVLKQAASENEEHLRQAIEDCVLPEVRRVEAAVKTARKMVKASIREKLVFGAGTLTVGLAVGHVTPNLGAIIAALGGLSYFRGLLEDLNALSREPGEVLNNQFYFLWRATKSA